MSDLITERTPLVIAAEINMIKHQTEKVLLNNAVEIGRRLKEAKGHLGMMSRKINRSITSSKKRPVIRASKR